METSVKLEAAIEIFNAETGTNTTKWVNDKNNPILKNLVKEYRERGSWKGFGAAIPSQFKSVSWSFLYTNQEEADSHMKRLCSLLEDMGWKGEPTEPRLCKPFTDKRTGEMIEDAYSRKVYRDVVDNSIPF